TGMVLTNAIKNSPLITPEKFVELYENSEDVQVIDVRGSEKYAAGHLESAVNIPFATIREKIADLDSEKTYVLYCDLGEASYKAQRILLNSGFKEVYNLSGGYKNYENLLSDLK